MRIRRESGCQKPAANKNRKGELVFGWRCLAGVGGYLPPFALDALEFLPVLDSLCQVNLAEGDLHFSDLVMLREPVKVVDGEDERLAHQVAIWKLLKGKSK